VRAGPQFSLRSQQSEGGRAAFSVGLLSLRRVLSLCYFCATSRCSLAPTDALVCCMLSPQPLPRRKRSARLQSQLTGAVRDYLLAGPASFGTETVCALGRSPSLRSGTPFLRLNSNSSRVIPFVSGTNMATNTIASTQKPPNT
jgi:hypothetical protein